MKDVKNKIYDILSGDTTLVNQLASNKPFNNPAGTSAKKNSIIPAFKATAKTVAPFITIQGGSQTRVGDYLYTTVVYVRVYNKNIKAFVEIDTIMNRIVALLHLQYLGLTEGVQVKLVRESVSSEFEDETMKLNYKEATFRLFML
jgi:hypothetical protein